MATTTVRPGTFNPPVPRTLTELGIPQALVLDLVLRRALLEGYCTIESISTALGLAPSLVEATFRQMRSQQMVDVKGMVGNDYQFVLSNAGKQLASERFQVSQYAGCAPVSLRDYQEATRAQTARPLVDRRVLRNAFSDLVLSDRMLDQLGPALVSQTSMFLYGPSGNGKTSIAERILRIYGDSVYIPYAVEVDNQIISLYDPVVHERIADDDPDVDPRWVLCRRPCIITGGELVPSMLELRLDDTSGIYAAPLQMKANNGIFIIDDFGRQLMSPRDLLNRWIVPLDRRVDYLTLRYGVKFQIPFDMLVVFSTNLDPYDLTDEAFLRRIRNKILVEPVDPKAFDNIFQRVIGARNVPADFDAAEYLRKLCLREGRTELRACVPGDICAIIETISRYENRSIQVDRPNLERAVNLYFAKT